MNRFFVAGRPVPKGSKNGRIGRNKFGKKFVVIYDQQKAVLKNWERSVRTAACQMWKDKEIIDGAVSVFLHFQFKRPKNHFTKKGKFTKNYKIFPIVKPDIDKLTRAILDGLTGVVYKDDAQVVTGIQHKRYAEPEGVWIEINELKEDSSDEQSK